MSEFQNQPGAPTPPTGPVNEPGKNQAIASLVLGIASLVIPYANLILAIIGIVMATQAKKLGNTGGMVTAGLVLSIIGIVIGAFWFFACSCAMCIAIPFM